MDLESRSAFVLAVLASVVLGTYLGSEHYAKHAPPPHDYDQIDAMIPMRDGVKLQTVVFVPRDARAPLPILLQRTPYDVPKDELTLLAEPRRAASRRLHLRVPEPARPLRLGGDVRHDPAAAGSRRSEGHRREHRRVRHGGLAGAPRARHQRARGHLGHVVRRLDDADGAPRPAPGARVRLRAGVPVG